MGIPGGPWLTNGRGGGVILGMPEDRVTHAPAQGRGWVGCVSLGPLVPHPM